jgi:hypothetical protein
VARIWLPKITVVDAITIASAWGDLDDLRYPIRDFEAKVSTLNKTNHLCDAPPQ